MLNQFFCLKIYQFKQEYCDHGCNVAVITWGRGPTTKKIMPPGKTQDILCLFCFFLFFFFQNTFKIDVFVPNLVKNLSSK